MLRIYLLLVSLALVSWDAAVAAAPLESKPSEEYFRQFHPLKAPEPTRLMLKKGDRLAICGDSITEQKMYSRIMETYLTVCVPELEITARQYGWSGEKAGGFLNRMTNDCLRFKPTIATTCYGMNDHEYRPYEPRIGNTYWNKSIAIVEAFKAHNVRVVHGSPGAVGKMPSWVKTASGTVNDLNLNLCQLRDMGIAISQREHVGFADVFWPMLTGGYAAQQKYGTNYMVTGKDGVHPGWAGQTVMAYAFLKALGCDGNIGTLALNLGNGKLRTSKGHAVTSSQGGAFEIRSDRYPFCATGKIDDDNSIRSGMALVPFNQDLNRFMLTAKGGKASQLQGDMGFPLPKPIQPKRWPKGSTSLKTSRKIHFPMRSIKWIKLSRRSRFTRQNRSKRFSMARKARRTWKLLQRKTEEARAPLAAAIHKAFVPVTHTLRVEPQ